jgi:hypothetical protein
VTLAAALFAARARAQSLITNGFFDDEGNVGWKPAIWEGALSYDVVEDADGDPRSGSAWLETHRSITNGQNNIGQCVPVSGGVAYFAAAKIRFSPWEDLAGEGFMNVFFESTPDCTGGDLSNVHSGSGLAHSVSQPRGTWIDLTIGDFQSGVIAPAGAKSAWVVVSIMKYVPNFALSMYIDDVVFAPVGVPLCRGLGATLFGTNGLDTLVGTSGPDVIVGLGGNDTIYGKGGNDVVCGGAGGDKLYGGGGADYLLGDDDDDLLKGGVGKDVVLGGDGADTIYGGRGDDVVSGGKAFDWCSMGADDTPNDAQQCEPWIIYLP